MNTSRPLAMALTLATILLASAAHAQTPPAVPAAQPDTAAKPVYLSVYFNTGSATIRKQDIAVLDHASRVYTDGKPTVMILTGSTDGTGGALPNLRLSQQRAVAVLLQLVARGIPAERFQILAKGESDPVVPDANGVAAQGDRRVEIAWR